MPRGKKKPTPEERLVQIEDEIENLTERLAALKAEKKNAEKEAREKQIGELYDVVKASGKSIEEVKEILAISGQAGSECQ